MPIDSVQYLNNAKLGPERKMQENYMREIINQFGIDVTYFRHDAAFYEEPTSNYIDFTYGEDTTMTFNLQSKVVVFIDMQSDSVLMNRLGLETNADADCYVIIEDFTEQFRDMVGKPMFTNVSVHVTAEIECGKGVLKGDIKNGCLDGFVEVPINVTFEDGVHGEVENAPFQRHTKKYNPFVKNSKEYGDRLVHGGLSGEWSGVLDENGNGTVEGVLSGELFYYMGPPVSQAPHWGIAPQVGDFFRLGFDEEIGNPEEYVITQIEDRNLQNDGISPFLGRYVWKMSIKRRDPSHEIVIKSECGDVNATEKEPWTVDSLRMGDLNEFMSDEIFDYNEERVDKVDGVKSDDIYGGYDVDHELQLSVNPPKECAMTEGLAYSLMDTPDYISGTVATDLNFLNDLVLKREAVVPSVLLSEFDLEVGRDKYIIVMDGCIELPHAGSWTFYLTSHDASAMILDHNVLIDNSGLHASTELSQTVQINGGPHDLKVLLSDYTGGQELQLEWEHASVPRAVVPSSAFKTEFGCTTECEDIIDNVIIDHTEKLVGHTINEVDVMDNQGVGGVFDTSPAIIELISEINEDIYYTLDGSEPTMASDIYTTPLSIEHETIIRYKTFDGLDETGEFTEYVTFSHHNDCFLYMQYGDVTGITLDGNVFDSILNLGNRPSTILPLISNRNPADFEPFTTAITQLIPNIYFGLGSLGCTDSVGIDLNVQSQYDAVMELACQILVYSDKLFIEKFCSMVSKSGDAKVVEFLAELKDKGFTDIIIDEWVGRASINGCASTWDDVDGLLVYYDDSFNLPLYKLKKQMKDSDHVKIYATYSPEAQQALQDAETGQIGESIEIMELGVEDQVNTTLPYKWIPVWTNIYNPIDLNTIYWMEFAFCGMDKFLFSTVSQGTISPSISVSGLGQANWSWGDGNETIDNNAPTYTFVDNLPSHMVDISSTDLNPLDVLNMNVENDEVTMINVQSFLNLEQLRVSFNLLEYLDLSQQRALVSLFASSNNITSVDLPIDGQSLEMININNNDLNTIDITKYSKLLKVEIGSNNLTALDISNNTQLTTLTCNNNNLTALDISNNTQLTTLWVRGNNLPSDQIDQILIDLDAHGLTNGTLDYSNMLGEVGMTACGAYDNLIAKGWTITGQVPVCTSGTFITTSQGTITPTITTSDTSVADWQWGDGNVTVDNNSPTYTYTDGLPMHNVDISGVSPLNIQYLALNSDSVTNVDVSPYTEMENLTLLDNALTNVDITANTKLKWLRLSDNQLTSIDISHITGTLEYLWLSSNFVGNVDISNHTRLRQILMSNCGMDSIDVSALTLLTNLSINDNILPTSEIDQIIIDLDTNGNSNGILDYSNNAGDPSSDAYDAYNALVAKGWTITGAAPESPIVGELLFTTTSTGTITPAIATSDSSLADWDWGDGNITTHDNSPTHTYTDGLFSHDVLLGVDPLELTTLNCGDNNISALDVSINTQLNELLCFTNNISVLDVSNNTQLTTLTCGSNNISALDVSNNTQLTSLTCGNNNISALDVSNNTQLNTLGCYNNNISTLDISSNTQLTVLTCGNNNISVLDVSNNTQLTTLGALNCALTSDQIDAILIQLDTNGLSNGIINYQGNNGVPTSDSYDAYNALISKGWTITGLPPV